MEEVKGLLPYQSQCESLLYCSDVFSLNKTQVSLSVNQLSLVLFFHTKKHREETYPWANVLGATIYKKKNSEYLKILLFSKELTEKKALVTYLFSTENLLEWVRIIQSMAFSQEMPHSGDRVLRKRLFVLINPASGKGAAAKLWAKLQGLFESCEVDSMLTEYQGHAHEVISNLSLDSYDAIIVVSGDGLVHEAINALCTRSDSQAARMFPLCLIPGGSGNALGATLCELSGIRTSPSHCAFLAIKGKATPIDITRITTVTGKVIYSFLSFAWAFIADVDIGSEIYRCCGGCRFDIYGFWRVLSLHRYQASITYTRNDNETTQEGTFIYFLAMNLPYLAAGMHIAPTAKLNDGCNDLLLMGNRSRSELLGVLLRQDSGNHTALPQLTYEKADKWVLSPVNTRGVFSIDGEMYPVEEVRAESLPGFATVMTLS